MASSKTIINKWIKNFTKCPLVDKDLGTFRKEIALQLFYGKRDVNYPDEYPSNYRSFYESNYALDRTDAVETVLRFLHFIGIRLKREVVDLHILSNPADFHNLLERCYWLFKALAHHKPDMDIKKPFVDSWGNIYFLVRIETGQAQLTIFDDLALPQLYNKYVKIPEGYENDSTVIELFNKIETTNDSFFITGKAGTGKSTFIHYFAQTTKKQVLLVAFTGIAAINVGGVTIHSFFQFPLRPLLPVDDEIPIFQENHERRKIISEIDALIIDEVSMLRADVLQAIDYSLRQNGGSPHHPFGGKQILFVGDIFQLPPVTADSNGIDRDLFRELFKSPYFFDSPAYKDLSPGFFEFKKSQRQKEDLQFVEVLDRVRTCCLDPESLAILNARYNPPYQPKPEEFVITLTTTNAIANTENNKRLLELHWTEYEFDADIVGDFPEDKYPTNPNLVLKQNAQIVLIKNDPQRRWVNGTIAKVQFIASDIIEVRLPDGNVYTLEREAWEHRGYRYDKSLRKITSEVKGTFTQFPIKLAWAITIHKSQGLTFDNVIIDLGTGAFVSGQVYTALSRCRTLKGITLRRKIRDGDVIPDVRLVDFYRRHYSSANP